MSKPRLKGLNQAVKFLLDHGRIQDIHPDHWFWSDKDVREEFGSGFNLVWSKKQTRKARIAYLIKLIENSDILIRSASGASIEGTTLSTLFLSFATGRIPLEGYFKDQSSSSITAHETGKYISSGRKLRGSQAEVREKSLTGYLSLDGLPPIFLADFLARRTNPLPKNELLDELKSEWERTAGLSWKWSTADRVGLAGKITAALPAQDKAPFKDVQKKTRGRQPATTDPAEDDSYPDYTALPELHIFKDEVDPKGNPKATTQADYTSDKGNTGKLVLGDLVFRIPPSAISFSVDAQSVSLPTLRTAGNPVMTLNTSVPRAQITLFFEGDKAINSLLRPLFAMYRNAPFTTVQNTTLHKMFMGKRLKKDGKTEVDPEEYFRVPVPVVLESISLHTIPGYPSTVQANVTLSLFNVAPYSPSGYKFLKTTEAASKQAHYNTRRYSRSFHTSLLTESENAEAGDVGTATFTDINGHSITLRPPNINTRTEVTPYPAESWPFVKSYRSSLIEGPSYPKKLSIPQWDLYDPAPDDLEIIYHSTATLELVQHRLERNLKNFEEIQNMLNMTYLALTDSKNRERFLSAKRIPEVRSAWFVEFLDIITALHNTGVLLTSLKLEFVEAYERLRSLGAGKQLGDLDLNFNYMRADDVHGRPVLDSILNRFLNNDYKIIQQLANGALDPEASDEDKQKARQLPPETLKKVIKIYQELQEGIIDGIQAEIERITKGDIREDEIKEQTLRLVAEPPMSEIVVQHPDAETSVFIVPVTGISVIYRNNLLAMPIMGFDRPTHQHMGGSNATISINMRTNDEELIKLLSDIRDSVTVLSRLIASGESELDGLNRIRIKHNLLQSLGLNRFSVSSINVDSIPTVPGWYEIFVDLIQSDRKLSEYEAIRLVSRFDDPTSAEEFFFPLKGIEFPPHDRMKLNMSQDQKDDLELIQNRIRVLDPLSDILPPPASGFRAQPGPSHLIAHMEELARSTLDKIRKDIIHTNIEDRYALDKDQRFDVTVRYGTYEQPGIGSEGREDTYYFYPWVRNRYTGAIDVKKSVAFVLLLRPALKRAEQVCGLIRKVLGNSSAGTSLIRQMESNYKNYIEMLGNNLSVLAKIRPRYIEENGVEKIILPQFIDNEEKFDTIQGFAINQARIRTFGIISARKDFFVFLSTLVDEGASLKEDLSGEDLEKLTSLKLGLEDYSRKIDLSIGPTYPDLPIPTYTLGEYDNNHYLFGPAFYSYIDHDWEEYKTMHSMIGKMHHSIALQLATLQGQITREEYDDLKTSLNEKLGFLAEELGDKMPDFLVTKKEDGTYELKLDEVFESFISFHEAVANGFKAGLNTNFDSKKDLEYLKEDPAGLNTNFDSKKDLEKYLKENPVLSLFKDNITVNYPGEDKPRTANPEMTKNTFYEVILAGVLLRYYIFVSTLAKSLGIDEEIVRIEVKRVSKKTGLGYTAEVNFYKAGQEDPVEKANLAEIASTIFNRQRGEGEGVGPTPFDIYSGLSSKQDSNRPESPFQSDEGIEERIYQAIMQIQDETKFLLTQRDPQAYMDWIGFSDLDADKKRVELEQKLKSEFESTPHKSLDRAFPTFKLFFVEENANNLLLFDDFYSYDAVHSIDVVSSKHAASSTAIIKLSNVTNRLTGLDIASLYHEGSRPDLPTMYLKPGTPILLRMGYGSDYRQLPIVFQGPITEVSPGGIVEITAQSWGAELTETLGGEGTLHYGSSAPIQTLGGVILDALDKTHGLNHFGRLTQLGFGEGDPSGGKSDSSNKLLAVARNPLLRWLIGVGGDFLGIPGLARSVQERLADRSQDHLFLNIGNPLYDNIYVNGLRTEDYGLINLVIGHWSPGRVVRNFQWVIERQTTWEAIWEVCTHLGDYIVAPLPYNEGGSIHRDPPRMTLYIGPREGYYQANDSHVNFESFGQEIERQATGMLTSIKDSLLNDEELPSNVMESVLDVMLPSIAQKMATLLYRSDAFRTSSVREDVYTVLSELQLQGYRNTYKLAVDEFNRLIETKEGWALTTKEGYLGLWYMILALVSGADTARMTDYFASSKIPGITSDHLLAFHRGVVEYMVSPGFLVAAPEFKKFHPLDAFSDTYRTEHKLALRQDIGTVLPRLLGRDPEALGVGSIGKALGDKLSAFGGAARLIFEPVVKHHFVNSYEDIISNNIIATADRMYNRVELTYPDEPGGSPAHIYNAVISYELDPSYVRTYSSFQKNIDYNVLHDYRRAKTGLDYGVEDALPSHIGIAHQVLMNQMKPMYQGQLTILGNPAIRPWHVVHLYDDVTDMTGPVEVEEVIHSFSPSNGFTTTIVPNLVVYHRNMGAYVDQNYMELLGALRKNRIRWKTLTGTASAFLKFSIIRAGGKRASKWGERKLKKPAKTAIKKGKQLSKIGSLAAKGAEAGGRFVVPLAAIIALADAAKIGYVGFKIYAEQTIGMAGIIAGHNPLIFVPLIYNGRPYVAGMEGITSYNRSMYSVVAGHIEDAQRGRLSKAFPIISNIIYNDPNALS